MRPIRIACGTVPKDSGTFSFYKNLRAGLWDSGIDVYCVSVGSEENALTVDSFVDGGCGSVASQERNTKRQSQEFVNWCREACVDVVIPLNSRAILCAIPHLPPNVRVISRCANSFDLGYWVTLLSRSRLSRIVAISPRQEQDLTNDYGVQKIDISLIPNGVDCSKFACAAARSRGTGRVLRLGFLGRLEHGQKGVLFLPDILHRLEASGVSFVMQIAGKGVHERALRRMLEKRQLESPVEFIGPLSHNDVPGFLGGVDVILFPSQFEGCPNVLLEAMAAGCVPVASCLEGITDWIIDDGQNGFVCEIGDGPDFADRLAMLAGDREKLAGLSKSASTKMQKEFSRAAMAAKYFDLFREIVRETPPEWIPAPWSDFRIDPAFREPSWKSLIPYSVKRAVKKALFHLGLSNRHF